MVWPHHKKMSRAEEEVRREQRAVERARFLHRNEVRRWTKILCAVAPLGKPGERPCSYTPWRDALRDFALDPTELGEATLPHDRLESRLMTMACTVAQPAWP